MRRITLRLIALILVTTTLSGCAGVIMAGAVGGAVMVNDRRSFSTQVDDHGLDVAITDALNQDEGLKNQSRIRVISMNRRVLLVGQVPNQMLKDRAVQIARANPDVLQIHDQLRIGNPVGFTTRSNDTWTTTKVKSRMFGDNELDAMRIKVITENGEVFLLGLVNNSEADLAVDVARTTSGVRKVIKVFEYQ
ncbi:division/outer membrane stress-associated lipid-binding lipoprotein [Ferrimonas balearica]|uniref:division/outer membrane stress-associated lipid-binding lipoprotein n=1 Tax=Ferrimonas balearica TaxID=44012 RepID=UPI001C99BCF9|nr:division/outer membrane stress-associated lipid-binding lipoprotein [Ferrimonas balearica]MBY5923214.1 divisome-associated lipoprotein YraP [Ferrimonas balearica]MBY5997410.1 divisome-associated lipoprotein YraP [Ferrimonas balearica]